MDAEGDRASDDGGNSVERSDRAVMRPTNRTDGGDDEEWGNPADSGGFPEEEKVEESFLEGWSTLFESGSSARKAPAPATTTAAVEEAGSFAVSNASAADNPSIISSAYSSTARGQNHPSTTMPPTQDPEATLKEPDTSADAGPRPTRLASRKKLLVIGALGVLVAVALAVVLPIVLIEDSPSPSSAGGRNEAPTKSPPMEPTKAPIMEPSTSRPAEMPSEQKETLAPIPPITFPPQPGPMSDNTGGIPTPMAPAAGQTMTPTRMEQPTPRMNPTEMPEVQPTAPFPQIPPMLTNPAPIPIPMPPPGPMGQIEAPTTPTNAPAATVPTMPTTTAPKAEPPGSPVFNVTQPPNQIRVVVND